MKKIGPISQKKRLLPFQDPSFGYGDFEGFFADFLRLHPVIEISRVGSKLEGRITNAWRYETSGDAQNGIDIRAEVQVRQVDGSTQEETWGFQCKHRARWSASQTTDAIKLAHEKFPAQFHFLLVTCDLAAAAVDEGRSHPGWQVWSRGEITARVRALPNRDEAARLLNTYFGAHWAEEILGLPGSGPLQASGAFFSRQMESGSLFHHKADVVGRQAELAELHEFLRNDEKRLLILPGAGGAGKSRLLKAFSQSLTPAQRRNWSIRFFEDIGVQVREEDLQALEGRPVIIVDDAHRRELEPLLRMVLRSGKAKVILATRPQGMAIVRGSASGAGVPAPRIQEMAPLKRLTPKEIKSIAESLLGNDFRSLASDIVAKARGCLLIVIVACELIRQRRPTGTHLASNRDFEQEVFVRLIDEGVARLGLIADRQRIDQILDHVALAGPVPREGPWFDLLVQDSGTDAKPSEVRAWLEKLKHAGLLAEGREGYRVSPDLLSDYLLFERTFDKSHRDQGFAADYLASVPENLQDEALARCLPNLAEAEWRARCETEGQHQSVVKPLLVSWKAQFERASFHRRRQMLGHWSRFGVYLPEQTLEIVDLARELTSSGAKNESGFLWPARDDYEDVVDALTPLLKEVALHHLEHMHACFDRLWSIGCDQPKRWMHSNQDHPLSAIVEVSALELRKSPAVNEHALAWMENQFTKPEVVERLKTPVWWFSTLLSPFLKHSVEDNRYDSESGVLSIEQIAIDADKVLSLRGRVLSLAASLAKCGHPGLAINALSVLGEAVRMINVPGLKDDRKLQQKWLPQRREALERIAAIARRHTSAFIHWTIWHELWWHICYEPTNLLREEVWQLFDLLSDTFELRLVRATCSTGESEITTSHKRDAVLRLEGRSWQQSCDFWEQLCIRVAAELAERFPNAGPLHDFLAGFIQQAAALGFSPTLRTIFLPLARHDPGLAEALAQEIITSPCIEAQRAFGALVDGLCPAGSAIRIDLVKAAAQSPRMILQEEASWLLLSWRRHQRLPEVGKELLMELARTSQPQVVRSMLRQASLLPSAADSFFTDLLVGVLANPFANDITEPLLALLARVEQKGSSPLPGNLVSLALVRLVPVPRIHSAMEQHHLNHLIESNPLEVFEFYRQRIAFSRDRARQDPLDQSAYEAFPAYGDHVSLAPFAKHPSFEEKFTELRDELIAIMRAKAADGDSRRIFESGGYHWKLRQLTRWMLDAAGAKYPILVGSWIAEINSLNELWLFHDAVIGDSPVLVLRHPTLLEALLAQIDSKFPEHTERSRKDLMSVVSCKVGSTSGLRRRGKRHPEPDEGEMPVIAKVEKLVRDHAHHSSLAKFYSNLLSECRSMLEARRRKDRQLIESDDDEM
ncbi:MAG: hypothetical protein CJBNEKGG_01886 [Prosthecobacter sp.]|nr:hypothetical protein [Prosthecobacter sp.]